MKKLIVGFSMIFGLGLSSQAQVFRGNTVTERTKFGIQGGLSIPFQTVGGTYDGYASHTSDAYAGFTAGLQVEVPLGNGWYLQPEANYTQMGGKDYLDGIVNPDGSTSNDVYTKIQNNYLQVPVLVKYKPMLQGFGIFFGPQYGYLLSGKEKYLDARGGNTTTTDLLNRSEFALAYGIEYYFPSANDGPSLGFSLKGVSGISNTVDKSKYDYPMSSVRNNAVFLTVGVRF